MQEQAKAREKKKNEKDKNNEPKIARNITIRSPIASNQTNACGTKNIRDTASSQSAMSSRLFSSHTSNFW
jgi:hypothetical protein